MTRSRFASAAALAALLAASAAGAPFAAKGFDFVGPTNRLVTPNGDGFNDTVTFRFANPRDSSGVIRIYDLRGRHIRDLDISVGDTSKSWDARADGRLVESGIYIYALSIEGRSFSGAVLVVR